MDTNKPTGGTELMFEELKRRLPQEVEKYSIFNYPVQADTTKKLIYWNQLSYDQPIVQFLNEADGIDQIDKFVFVSHWQSDKFREKFNIPGYKSFVIKNACIGVEETEIKPKQDGEKVKICYTSTPWRGLEVLLKAWELNTPDNCELHIFSSTKIYGDDFASSEERKYSELYEKAKSLKGVVYRGSIPNDELRKELVEFDILAYPCTFEETSCISVIEALSAGLRVVTSNVGALPETTEGWARMYPYRVDPDMHAQLFSKILSEEIDNIKSGSLIPHLKKQIEVYRNRWSWESRQQDWIDFFKNIEADDK